MASLVTVFAVVLVSTSSADVASSRPDPRKAAAALVARLRAESKRADGGTFAASKVVARSGSLWLAFGSTPAGAPYMGGGAEPGRVRVFRWSGRAWRLRGTVRGKLAPSQWINPVSLTGSRDPDFAIQGCGAGDTNCLSVVSDIGGPWHAHPFEYGYGRTLEVNGVPAGHLVHTEVDACSCAGGPSTWMYERHRNGTFEPTDPPGPKPECSASRFATIADPWQVQVLRFTRAACAGGWALAIGDGAGFAGPAVALFDRGSDGRRWELLTLDNGNALPTAPAIYDLPLSLLTRLASGLGRSLAPQVEAAKLIARLQSFYHFAWPQQNGIVSAAGNRWLIAVVPAGRASNGYSPVPVRAVIYRWSRTSWIVDGRLPRVRHHLNVDWFGGWFISVPTRSPGSVAFELVGSCCTTGSGGVAENAHSTGVITNAGGRWHVTPIRSRR